MLKKNYFIFKDLTSFYMLLLWVYSKVWGEHLII